MVVTVPAPGAESGLFPPVGVPNVWDLSMEHNETFVRIRLGTAAEGDEAAELLLWPAARPNGQAVVACPGGGFNQVALEREGYPFARWFNERGVTYAVLCYRMPRGRAGVPAEDIRCALALMRERAAEWGITRLGVMGASIGGHVASTAATLFDGEERPDFQVLLYPVISMLDAWAHRPSRGRLMGENLSAELCERLSLELHVTPQTAPAFIVLPRTMRSSRRCTRCATTRRCALTACRRSCTSTRAAATASPSTTPSPTRRSGSPSWSGSSRRCDLRRRGTPPDRFDAEKASLPG